MDLRRCRLTVHVHTPSVYGYGYSHRQNFCHHRYLVQALCEQESYIGLLMFRSHVDDFFVYLISFYAISFINEN